MSANPRYQQEPDPSVRDAIWARGRITALELFRIAAWKSAKGLASLALNSEDLIASQTAMTVDELRRYQGIDVTAGKQDWAEWENDARNLIGTSAQSGLLLLEGVGYPMASAILAFLAPAAFPVIDKWAVAGVFGEEVARRPWQWHRAAAYRSYAEHLASARVPTFRGANIHERDQLVMRRMMDGGSIAGLETIALSNPRAGR